MKLENQLYVKSANGNESHDVWVPPMSGPGPVPLLMHAESVRDPGGVLPFCYMSVIGTLFIQGLPVILMVSLCESYLCQPSTVSSNQTGESHVSILSLGDSHSRWLTCKDNLNLFLKMVI